MFRKLLTSVLFLLVMPIQAAPPKILVIGDSISAGYGIDIRQSWVQLLQQRLAQKGYPHQLVNASISGDTSASAKARLPGALKRHRPAIVILEIGGNDGLQGLSADTMQQNLGAMVSESRKYGARVLLLGMRLPPNYGPAYTEKFFSVYRRVATQQRVALVPFFLEGVAGQSALMQVDGIHPRAEAQSRLVDNLWPSLEALLNSG
jgi:acyl-CoA thioesterase-1